MRWCSSGVIDNPIDQCKQRLLEIDVEKRFRRRKFESLAILEKPVETLPAQLEEMVAQGFGGSRRSDRKQRVPARTLRVARAFAVLPGPPCRAPPVGRTAGNRTGPRAQTGGVESRTARLRSQLSTVDSESCSSAGSQWAARSRGSHPRRAFPCAPGTAAHKRKAIRRNGAGLRHRWCRKPATTCPIRKLQSQR